MRNILGKVGERFLNIADKYRAARACQEALLRKLLRLGKSDHIGAESGFDNGVEAQLFEPLNDLTELCICELARD